ncbi:MAG: hypothetical protein CMJ41_01580 [Phycisphaerae bacterium]|nr:hypothetical protein [Phycisphaerae bacterium]
MTPVRVLHLVDIQPGTDGRCLHRLVRRTVEGLQGCGEHVVLEVGGGERRQPYLPRTSGRLGPSRMLVGGGVSGEPLWRVLEVWANAGRPFDLVHCWGDASLRLRAACAGGPPTYCTLDSMVLDASMMIDVHDLSGIVPLEIQVGSVGMVDALHEAGLELEVAVVPFGLDVDRSSADPVRRDSWGVDDGTMVFGVVGDRIGKASLGSLVGVPVRLAASGRDVRIIASEETGGFADCRRWLHDMDRKGLLVADDMTQAAGSSVDFALAQGTTGRCGEVTGLLAILESLDASRPVLLGHGHPACRELSECDAVFSGMDHAETDAARWLLSRSGDQRVDASGLLSDVSTWCGSLAGRYAVLAE